MVLTVFGAARNTLHLVQCELLFLVFFFFFPHLVVSTRLLSAFQGVFMCSLATRLNLTAFFFVSLKAKTLRRLCENGVGTRCFFCRVASLFDLCPSLLFFVLSISLSIQ